MSIDPSLLNLDVALPEIVLAVASMVILIIGVFKGDKQTPFVSWLSVGALVAVLGLVLFSDGQRNEAFNGLFVNDSYAIFLKSVILVGLIVSIMISTPSLAIRGMMRFEYPVLILLAGLGMMIMVSSNHLLTLYMGAELQALSLYVLAALQRGSGKSSEAGLKYFILGALSSGILLFGISLVYGFSGTLYFPDLFKVVAQNDALNPGLITGLVFVLIALAFKISAVPFHMWTPDVYEGAPTPVTALFVIVPKVAALGLIMRFVFDAFGAAVFEWSQIILFLSVASMFWGAFAALVQNNIKRLMAYSSIGNVGYALVGLVAGTQAGVSSVLIYMTIYMVMTAGVFACILRLNRNELEVKTVPELAGLVKTDPYTAYILAILLFSMTGLPPLAGFFGKLVVFQAAVEAGHIILAVFGVLTSVVAAYYYLRIIKVMMFDDGSDPLDKEVVLSRRLVAGVSAALTLIFIVRPDMLFELTDMAAISLLGAG